MAEIERLDDIISSPQRILSDFYDAYRPNLLQKIMEMQGYSEDALYEVLITQVSKLPALSNCKMTRANKEPMAPIRISYRNPAFELMVLDIKAHKYESVFASVAKGLEYRMRDAAVLREDAQKNVGEMKMLDSRVRTICAGEIPLRRTSFTKRGALKQYLAGIGYSKEQANRACENTGGFLHNIQEEIDKRQSLLAEALQEYSECMAQKESFENDPYLQNAVKDLTELLQNCGYLSKANLGGSI